LQAHPERFHLVLQLLERGIISSGKCPDHDIQTFDVRNHSCPGQFSQPSSETVPLDDRMTVLPYNDGQTCMRKQGVDGPDIEMFGAQSSPCFLHQLQI
jgi:hypothetical protein